MRRDKWAVPAPPNDAAGVESADFRFDELGLEGLRRITPRRREDARGWRCETHEDAEFATVGVRCGFVQETQTLTTREGVVRGLHFSDPPLRAGLSQRERRLASPAEAGMGTP